MKLKKGDTIFVISGKDKGKTGQIEQVFSKENKILVTGINIVKKAVKPTKKNPQGGIIEKNKAINMSVVMLKCPQCDKPTRLGFKEIAKGKKLRICRKCKESVEK